jgi:hypothetical protein
MSLAGDAVFDGALGAGRLLANGEGVGRLLAKEEGAGLARELDTALGIDMGTPKAGRGAFCLAAGAAAVQSVFKRSSILSASLSEVFRHGNLLLSRNWLAISGCYETHEPAVKPASLAQSRTKERSVSTVWGCCSANFP